MGWGGGAGHGWEHGGGSKTQKQKKIHGFIKEAVC